MSTPGMQWAQLMSQMSANNINAARTGIPGNQGQQQIDIEQQQEQRQQQQAAQDRQLNEIKLHNALLDNGYTFLHNGLKQVTATAPDGYTQVPLMVPADKSRIYTMKSPEGDQQYEAPASLSDQLLAKWNAGAPERQGEVDQAGQEAQARTLGIAAGATAGKQNDLAERGWTVDQDFADQYGLPDSMVGQKISPEDRDALTQRVGVANTRADAMQGVADTRAKSAADMLKQRQQFEDSVNSAKQDFQAQQNQTRLDYQDRWASARNAMLSNTQGSLNNRASMRQFDSNMAQHGRLQDIIYREQQRQLEGQALMDPTAMPDGQDFNDPWSGRKMTMGPGQRARIKASLNASQAQVNRLQNQSQTIEQQYNLGAFGNGGDGGGPFAGASGLPGAGSAPGAVPNLRGAGNAPGASGPPAAGAGDTVQIITGAGQKGTIPRANLSKAKQRDPKLQVIGQ